ncbi:hypothetical protein E2562_021219 [Oryza meyeriana var. granulata]|uniref:Uncharacterized protein n=1 Tax=Oryza meyeriana var. granulata TaxID=110450 RepID=A0A6G1DYX9_9ORYZ|nr:hypothetical protein E2562_021219 [Oryza meyeriana var. granulata]
MQGSMLLGTIEEEEKKLKATIEEVEKQYSEISSEMKDLDIKSKELEELEERDQDAESQIIPLFPGDSGVDQLVEIKSEALIHPFFDELRDPNTRLPNGRFLPPLFNFKPHGKACRTD